MKTQAALHHLAAVDPVLVSALEQFESDNGTEIPIVGLGRIGSALVQNIESIDEESVRELFDRTDVLLGCGDEQTETAIATGFLEAIVSHTEESGRSRDSIEKYFGPRSVDYVTKWDADLGIVRGEANPGDPN